MEDNGVIRFGWNGANQLSPSSDDVIGPSYFSEIPTSSTVRGVACGHRTTLLFTKSGDLIGCGHDNGILLGNAKETDGDKVTIPTTLKLKFKVWKAFCGANHASAIDFFHQLFTWGSNEFGQLGRLVDIDNKIEYKPDLCLKGVPVIDAALGFSHTIILTDGGKVFVCGDGRRGQLGLGTEKVVSHENNGKWIVRNITSSSPTMVESFDHIEIIGIAAGDYHSLFLDKQGLLYSCGDNTFGRLGYAVNNANPKPKKLPVFGSKKFRQIKGVDLAQSHNNSGTKAENSVMDANVNNDSNGNIQTDPIEEVCFLKACRIGAGGASNYALANDNKVYTWGFNSRGQLGLGSFTNVISPSPIESFGDHTGIVIISVSMGEDHTIFLSETGNLYGCGLSSSGRLGILFDDDMDHKTESLTNKL